MGINDLILEKVPRKVKDFGELKIGDEIFGEEIVYLEGNRMKTIEKTKEMNMGKDNEEKYFLNEYSVNWGELKNTNRMFITKQTYEKYLEKIK